MLSLLWGGREDISKGRIEKWWETTAVDYEKPDHRRTYSDGSYKLIRNHPLLLMAQCQQIRLMSLDYCTQLRKKKFARFSRWVFASIFLVYLLFLGVYTAVILQIKHPQYYYDLYNSSGNTSGQNIDWDYGFNSQLCRRVGVYLTQSGNTEAQQSNLFQRETYALDVFLIIFLAKNFFLLVASFPRLLRKLSYYVEGVALILAFVFIRDDASWQTTLNFRCPIQWQVVSVAVVNERETYEKTSPADKFLLTQDLRVRVSLGSWTSKKNA